MIPGTGSSGGSGTGSSEGRKRKRENERGQGWTAIASRRSTRSISLPRSPALRADALRAASAPPLYDSSVEYGAFILLALYLLPAFVAASREHPHFGVLTLFNIGLGWTGAGWLAALLWAAPPIRTWAWLPTLHRAPPLRVVRARPRIPVTRRPRPAPGAPLSLIACLGLLAGSFALAGDASWQNAQYRAPYLSGVVRVSSADLRAGPGRAHPALGSLPLGCRLRILEMRGGWQRIWKTSACSARSTGPNEGWMRRSETRR